MTRHLPLMPVVSAVMVLVFGGATLILHDETFIKLKPTIIYVLFGGTLLGGLLSASRCSASSSTVFHLTDEGWRKLTFAGPCSFWRWRCSTNRLAHAFDRHLGELQGFRRVAADVPVRRAAISAALSVTRATLRKTKASATGRALPVPPARADSACGRPGRFFQNKCRTAPPPAGRRGRRNCR